VRIVIKNRENPKKTVEIWETRLTKSFERPKVNGGTVLRTRINTGDFDPAVSGGDP
jgi:hypothetical protein